MAKRKPVHWAARRKAKQARVGDDSAANDAQDKPDRRESFPEVIHPGSYAAARARQQPPPPVAVSSATKRRYGLWLAFCGKNYSGMQMNEGVQTIEAEVERALFEAGAIAESNYGFLQKIGWSRAARTDKGVHAAGQLLTAKLHVGDDIPAFLEKVNKALPADIRILHMVTVTKNFNAKNSCDQRTYEYLAPTFIFAKRASNPDAAADADAERSILDSEEGFNSNLVIDATTLEAHRQFRLSDETYDRINEVLRLYEGTHNFHNFTSKLEPSSPQCRRFIISFSADRPFVENNMEWIRLRVVGQSFLLHHIRKMIGTAVEIVAGVTDSATIERATQMEKMDLPKAPSVGLYLAQAHFEVYNNKVQDSIQASHPPLTLDDPEVAQKVEQFKRDFIFDHIIKHEESTRTYAKWLRTMEILPFGYIAKPYDEWKAEKEEEAKITDRSAKLQAAKAARMAFKQASSCDAAPKGGEEASTTSN